MKTVVLQPTYLPWMGYFGMMDVADTFVYYDDVQFSKQSWQQRNRIRSANKDFMWLTVPVKKGFGQRICDTRIDNSSMWRKKHWRSIEATYAMSPFFESFSGQIKDVFNREWELLVDLNIATIDILARLIGIDMPELLRSCEIEGLEGTKMERLLGLLGAMGADEYISGPSARDYIDPAVFRERGIQLHWFEFNHPIYPQNRGDFVPYLSSLDLLFNVGERSLEYIREGLKDAVRHS